MIADPKHSRGLPASWQEGLPGEPNTVDPSPGIKYSHYRKDISKYKVLDIYRLLRIYKVTDPCIGHAVKKLLCPGGRGSKTTIQDIKEAIDSLQRYVEMEAEDGEIC